MPVTPGWQAPTTGQQANAGHVNQLLGTHSIVYVYTGVSQSSSTLGSGSIASNGLWMAQQFTTASGQTTTGVVGVTIATTGSPASPWALSIQASSGGAPSGTALASTSVPKEFLSGTPTSRGVLLPVTGLTPLTTYWIVANSNGTNTDEYAWSKSTAGSGASTSTNGTSWTAQAYGLTFVVFDGTAVPPLAGTWEDSGARWTFLGYSGGQLSLIKEFTAGQTVPGYTASSRALSYTSGLLTGVT